MNPFEMVVIIVALVVFGRYLQTRAESRRQETAAAEGSPSEDRIAQLEERVKVLERIVTDSGYDLRRQFRDLERDA